MSIQFEWWSDNQTIHEEAYQARRWRIRTRRGIIHLALVLALPAITAGALLLLQLRHHQQQVEADITARLLETYDLMHVVAQRQPAQGLRNPPPGLDPTWALQQAQAYGLADRSGLGLQVAEIGPVLIETDLAPDLNTAVLVVNQTYLTKQEVWGQTQPIVLQQAHVFARQGDRWLLITPPDTFWGEWQSTERSNLTLTYPARDRPIAARLADDLDTALDELCQRLVDIQCPPDLQLSITLDTNHASLAALRRERVRVGSWQVALPAPTLTGVPVDTLSYRALLQGYTAHIASVLVTDIVGWDCGDHLRLYQNLIQGRLVCGGRAGG